MVSRKVARVTVRLITRSDDGYVAVTAPRDEPIERDVQWETSENEPWRGGEDMAKKKTARKTVDSGDAPGASSKRPIESYTHDGQQRVNNPPVGLVTQITDPPEPPRQRYEFDPHLDPQLVWAGKAERTSFEIPTVSLHVHEWIDPKSIIAAVRTNGSGGFR